ncbi:MAG: enoyl-CoA hydratase/isomerase family protein [Bacteroidetes bacterium]|nr:enoyl-CoA hydratase/isomerase family protein [Bacteroidota bacterium]MBU1486225.1 enoyl-CoA hydratase/isomerase family protein [Bacteroidota bacterium]MBU2267488.1 enoyl-CoA hydratase/isomerase family protein [Bacteroidota bacterium]MBU2375535.1 enoyl-CoA hydratase/isomerase family protein [Bacteroidota bacterium]
MLVDYQVSERIASITLNRAEKRNALNSEVVKELIKAFETAEHDEQVKVIILKANGDVFSAGADLDYLKKLQSNSFEENLSDSNLLKKLFQQIYQQPKIVIAQVEGHAIAGGCGLASICDYIFSVPEARFGYTEVKIGFIPAIVAVFLVRRIGEGKAKELLFGGDLIDAEKAQNLGLINYIIDPNKIADEVKSFALKLCKSTSAQSIALTKQLLNNVQDLPLAEALEFASEMNAHARSTDDCKKGISAFLNKIKIEW